MNPLAWLEADMARHMLIEFPLLLVLGAALAKHAPGTDRMLAPYDRHGLTGWTFASLVLAFWMIPAALDAAIGSAAVRAAKYASLVTAGSALRSAMRRSSIPLEAFFVGNFTWMGATVGLVYQESETRLCLSYLVDSQQRAGRGLVFAAIAALVLWFVLRARDRVATGARSPCAANPPRVLSDEGGDDADLGAELQRACQHRERARQADLVEPSGSPAPHQHVPVEQARYPVDEDSHTDVQCVGVDDHLKNLSQRSSC